MLDLSLRGHGLRITKLGDRILKNIFVATNNEGLIFIFLVCSLYTLSYK
jgi:hypothetical protein